MGLRYLVPIKNKPASGFSELHSGSFDGTTSYLAYGGTGGDSLDFATNQAFTFSTWVYINSFGTVGAALVSRYASTGAGYLFYYDQNGFITTFIQNSNAETLVNVSTSAALTSTATWHKVDITVDGTQSNTSVKIYVNASLVPMTLSGNTLAGSNKSGLAGSIGTNNNAMTHFANALFDEVSFWSTALTSGQVTTYYNSGTPTNLAGQSGLLTWWRFEDTVLSPVDTSSTIYDRAGTNNATNNSVTFSTNVP